jgi:hypothetical protein
MSEPYVSPIPVIVECDYFDRVEGAAVDRRRHQYRQADGSIIPCRPRFCRECYREGYRHV